LGEAGALPPPLGMSGNLISGNLGSSGTEEFLSPVTDLSGDKPVPATRGVEKAIKGGRLENGSIRSVFSDLILLCTSFARSDGSVDLTRPGTELGSFTFPSFPLVSFPLASFPFWATTVPDENEDAAGLAEGEALAVALAEGEGEGLDEVFASSPPQEVNPIAIAPAITQEAGIRIIHSPQNFSPRYPLFQEMTQFLKELEMFLMFSVRLRWIQER
jgi:hypothetical protein